MVQRTSVNVEFNSHYYSIVKLGSVDPALPKTLVLIPLLNSGWILWGASVIATAIVLLYRRRSNKAKA